ncbi:OLC1v1036193C1 [Oldenlandia corymbosa var. corymbosa]|uniref:OLC1v1036193C1 n=1 Tax=Oldenlandia corymbosa var. corymbosa TaxID=529605 RepID=A0AAV1CVY6_OLDCO|nr:OLC1v1036193C1 [Oldenlandia corymbosa var. corymbosa]
MATGAVEKSQEELRKEIYELHRQQREINERLRDPRGLRRGGLSGPGPRNLAVNGGRQRGFVRPADRTDSEDQPAPKRRLSSAVFKVEDGEIVERRTWKFLQRSMFPEYCPKMRIQVWRTGTRGGWALGTLERFRKEDMQLSGSEAYMRRSDSLKRAEQWAREESEKLRQQEREQIAGFDSKSTCGSQG